MVVVLTGSRGFVGKHLLQRLAGHEIICLGHGDAIPAKADVVFHLAAEITDERRMFESNVVLTYSLLAKCDCESFVYVGSSSEYGRLDRPIVETDRLAPTNLYEATKGCGSLLALAFASRKRIMIARPFSLYGPGNHCYRFMPAIFEAWRTGTSLTVWKGHHDWCYVSDFVEGLMLLWERGQSGDIVNFGTGKQTSNLAVVNAFESVLGPISYVTIDAYAKPYDSESWVCDPAFAREKYGWQCRSLEDGVRCYVKAENP